MTTNYNMDLTNEFRDVGKIQTARDPIPNQFADKIVPVVDVNPKHSRVINIASFLSSAAAGDEAIYTTPTAGKDFYLTGITISWAKDNVSDGVAVSVYTYIGGALSYLAFSKALTLTAVNKDLVITFPIPIKVDRGRVISLSKAHTLGSNSYAGTVHGYLVDNPNA